MNEYMHSSLERHKGYIWNQLKSSKLTTSNIKQHHACSEWHSVTKMELQVRCTVRYCSQMLVRDLSPEAVPQSQPIDCPEEDEHTKHIIASISTQTFSLPVSVPLASEACRNCKRALYNSHYCGMCFRERRLKARKLSLSLCPFYALWVWMERLGLCIAMERWQSLLGPSRKR